MNKVDRLLAQLEQRFLVGTRWRWLSGRLAWHHKTRWEHGHAVRKKWELEVEVRHRRRDSGVAVRSFVLLPPLWYAESGSRRRIASRARALLTPSIGLHAPADGCDRKSVRIRGYVEGVITVPLEETPAPISISGSSTAIPLSIGLPPVPPNSAVNIHLRSASVRRSMGMMLMPVW